MKQAYVGASENTQCSWFNSKLEELFSDALPAAELERANQHMAGCASCREEVESLRAIDPLIKNVLRYRTTLAAAPARPRFHFGRTFSALAAALGVLVVGMTLWNIGQPSAAGPDIAATVGENPREKTDEPEGIKNAGTEDTERGKPEDSPDAPDAPRAGSIVEKGGAEGFAVIDAGGYERRLADFRGQVLLIGVLAPRQPRAAANLERLYKAFGTRLRLLAIAGNRKEPAPQNTTFQILYNNGSDLLGAQEAEYALVDRGGAVVSRGSLTGEPSALVNTIGAAIKALETR